MSLIFIGYVMYNSKQQAKYQEYMTQVQAEEQARAEAEAAEMAAIEAAQPTDSLSIAQAAEAAKQREISIFGESLLAAKQGVAEQFTMSNDYITVDFTTQGGMMKKVVLAEYTKYAPKEERNEQVVLFDGQIGLLNLFTPFLQHFRHRITAYFELSCRFSLRDTLTVHGDDLTVSAVFTGLTDRIACCVWLCMAPWLVHPCKRMQTDCVLLLRRNLQ